MAQGGWTAGGHSPRVKVSVITPAFQAENHLALALDSALSQTMADLEVIVIDDASTDATLAVAQAFARRDARVRCLSMATNRGPGACRNAGVAQARGEWIALLDADDRYAPERLAVLLEMAERRGADMVSDNLMLVSETTGDEDRMIATDQLPTEQPLNLRELVDRNVMTESGRRDSWGFMQPIISRDFLRRENIAYDEACRCGEDFMLSLDLLMHGANWWVTPRPMYHYLVRAGSLTATRSSSDVETLTAKVRAVLASPVARSDSALRRSLGRHFRALARRQTYETFIGAMRCGEIRQAVLSLIRTPYGARLALREARWIAASPGTRDPDEPFESVMTCLEVVLLDTPMAQLERPAVAVTILFTSMFWRRRFLDSRQWLLTAWRSYMAAVCSPVEWEDLQW